MACWQRVRQRSQKTPPSTAHSRSSNQVTTGYSGCFAGSGSPLAVFVVGGGLIDIEIRGIGDVTG